MRSEEAKSNADGHSAAQNIMTAAKSSNGTDHAAAIDQVRELLFGETKRSTEKDLKALEDRVEALTANMMARFSEIEARISEVQKDADTSQAHMVDEIGAAISQLGASIRNMSGARKSK